jgi:RNA polymerase sigma-70 factor, ECF subfamily
MNKTLVAPAIEAPTEAETAFEALYRSSRDDLFAYAAGLLRDRSAAEEVTAQAFERAYRRRASFDPRRGTRRAWLFGIARNAALDELRRLRRQANLLAEPGDEPAVDAAEELAEAALRRSAIRAAIAALPGSASWWR